MSAWPSRLWRGLQRGWSRCLPQSLFGRLMAVLAAGLMLAQVLSAAINVAERDQLLTRGFGQPAAQRIADVVLLLDSLEPVERERVVAVFGVPPLVLSLQNGPLIPAAAADAAVAAAGRGALFSNRLRAVLGDERALRVEMRPGFDAGLEMGRGGGRRHHERMGSDWPHRMERGAGGDVGASTGAGTGTGASKGASTDSIAGAGAARGRPSGPRPGAALPVLRTEVQLLDGRWARFDTELPARPETLPWRLVLSLAVLLLSMLGLSWLAVRWVVQPLHVLAQAAQGLGEDLARPPLPEDGPREVRQAAQAFNTMQQRLAQFVNERTRMLTALSHDLKTPLTRMRLRTELLDDDEARVRFESDLLEMETMVAQTLDFMRGLGGHEARAPVDINALLAALQADNVAMGRTLVIDGRSASPFLGVPSLLRRALGNLIDNAMLYGGSGTVGTVDALDTDGTGSTPGVSRVTVRIEDGPERLLLHVLDTGPGIPEAELERVFDSYRRLEGSRSRSTGGTGLGLGIARNIARLHGGDVVLSNRAAGGLDALLSLPRRPLPT